MLYGKLKKDKSKLLTYQWLSALNLACFYIFLHNMETLKWATNYH